MLPKVGGIYVQMEDEISSMAALLGASVAGKKAYTATSGPGISLMQENLGLGIMSEIPAVIIDVQRSGPSTGAATKPAQGDMMQARWGTHGDHSMIALSPASVQECFDLTVQAFNLAEKYRTPVYLMADETIGHLRETVTIRTLDPSEIIDRKQPDKGISPLISAHINTMASCLPQCRPLVLISICPAPPVLPMTRGESSAPLRKISTA